MKHNKGNTIDTCSPESIIAGCRVTVIVKLCFDSEGFVLLGVVSRTQNAVNGPTLDNWVVCQEILIRKEQEHSFQHCPVPCLDRYV